jgi:hypothetical protein
MQNIFCTKPFVHTSCIGKILKLHTLSSQVEDVHHVWMKFSFMVQLEINSSVQSVAESRLHYSHPYRFKFLFTRRVMNRVLVQAISC